MKTKDQLQQLEIEECRNKLKSSQIAIEELKQENQKLIKDKNQVTNELEECRDELQKALNKYKILEQDYQLLSQGFKGNTNQELELLKAQLREEKIKNENLNVVLQKIPKLQKIMEQKEQDYLKQQKYNEKEKQQLQNDLEYYKDQYANICISFSR